MTRSRLYLRSSSFKMALLFTVLLSAAVLSLGYFIYDFGREGLERDSESALDLEINNILLIKELESDRGLVSIVNERVDTSRGIHYLLTNLKGEYLAGDMQQLPVEVDLLVEGIIVFELEAMPDGDKEGHKLVAKIHTFEDGSQLLVARDIEEFFSRFARLRLLSILSIGCMMLVIIVSFLISLFVVSRINRISDTALEIMKTGDLSRRLTIDSRWDDLSHLSVVLNQMLERIETLVEGVKQVSNNIAHDLRTPLTRIRNKLEDIQANGIAKEEIQPVIIEADQLLETFTALLRIARLEVGQERTGFSQVDVKNVLRDVIELYEPTIVEIGSRLNLQMDNVRPLHGDRNLLFQAFVNILDNTVKHAGEGVEIVVRLNQPGPDIIVLEFEDSGPGISSDEKEKVFQRFYRCDQSRSRSGSGLGLSMVAAVIQLHDGKVELYDAPAGGLGIKISFPISPAKVT